MIVFSRKVYLSTGVAGQQVVASTGVTIGAVIGALVVVCAIAAGGFLYYRYIFDC